MCVIFEVRTEFLNSILMSFGLQRFKKKLINVMQMEMAQERSWNKERRTGLGSCYLVEYRGEFCIVCLYGPLAKGTLSPIPSSTILWNPSSCID
jgi:hypothetical protein